MKKIKILLKIIKTFYNKDDDLVFEINRINNDNVSVFKEIIGEKKEINAAKLREKYILSDSIQIVVYKKRI